MKKIEAWYKKTMYKLNTDEFDSPLDLLDSLLAGFVTIFLAFIALLLLAFLILTAPIWGIPYFLWRIMACEEDEW